MLPLRYNLLLLGFTSGTYATLVLLWGGDSSDIWLHSAGFLLTFNLLYAYRERAGTAKMVAETDTEQLFRGLGFGFLAVLISLPLLLTYRGLEGAALSRDVAWIVLPGVAVTFAAWAVYELQSRRA